MAISEVCQFELKEEVDKLKAEHPDLSLADCIRQMVQFYADAGIEVKEETARTKYKRASKIGSNEPAQPTPQDHTENQENQDYIVCEKCGHKYLEVNMENNICLTCWKKMHGGQREGAGRKPKYYHPPKPITSEDKVNIKNQYPMSEVFHRAYDSMLYAIREEQNHDYDRMSKESIYWHLETFYQILSED